MGTEVYELADALLGDLLGSSRHERARVLARYRTDHAWNPDSISIVLGLIEDLHAKGRFTQSELGRLRAEVSTWPDTSAADDTDELPALIDLEGDEPTEALDADVDPAPQMRADGSSVLPVAEPIDAAVAAEPAPPRLEPGSVLVKRYRLERIAGAGGYCLVFLARDLRREAYESGEVRIVVKALRPELATDERAIARLKHEFRTVGQLSHPGIVRVLDLDCEVGQWFFTMEYLEGESLAAHLRDAGSEPLPRTETLDILDGCADALDYAHGRGEVHGDIKPANVFVTAGGEIKLIDWSGRGPQVGSDDPEGRGRAATRAYASPEVLDGAWPEREDDIFSLSCVAYELLAGRHPFDGESSASWRDAKRRPAHLETLTSVAADALDRGLAWQRNERPASASELVAALRAPAPVPRPEPHTQSSAGVEVAAATFAATVDLTADTIPARDLRQEDWIRHEDTTEKKKEEQPVSQAKAAPVPAVPASLPIAVVADTTPSAPAEAWWSRRPVVIGASMIAFVLLLMLLARSPPTPEPVADDAGPTVASGVGRTEEAASAEGGAAAVDSAVNADASGTALAESAQPSPAEAVIPEQLGTAELAPIAEPVEPAPPVATVAAGAPASAPPAASRAPPAAPVTWISFEAPDVVTSEAAVVAVLRLQRLERIAGRVRVTWRAVAGTAAEGEDFEAAQGTAEFADGQSLRAIYVPLRNDDLVEENESFFVELSSNRRDVRIGPIAKVKITIRDDE